MIVAVFDGPHGQRVRVFENPHAVEQWRQSLAKQYWSQSGIKSPFELQDPEEAANRFFASDMHWFQVHEDVRLEYSFTPDALDEREVQRIITIGETLRKREAAE